MKDTKNRFPRFSKLMKLYPNVYRQRYEQEMLQTIADMLDDAPNWLTKAIVWSHIAVDLPINITRQQLRFAGGIMHNEMPPYIKRNSIVGGILLVPFFASLLADSIDKVVYNHVLYETWFWHSWVLAFFFLWLPEVALILFIGSYVYFVAKRGKQASWFSKLFDVNHLWPLIIPGVLAFGILFIIAFHDSGQCLGHSPSYLKSHAKQTWQCIAPASKLLRKALP